MAALVRCMCEEPDLARGQMNKTLTKKTWQRITKDLNALGPPTRTLEKWCKVWADFKSKARIKIRHNRTIEQSNDDLGKKQQLNHLEEQIIPIFYEDIASERPRQNKSEKPTVVKKEPVSSTFKKEPSSSALSISSRGSSPALSMKSSESEDPLSYEFFEADGIESTTLTAMNKEQLKIQANFYNRMVKLKEKELEWKKKKFELLQTEFARRHQYRRQKLFMKQKYLQKKRQAIENANQ